MPISGQEIAHRLKGGTGDQIIGRLDLGGKPRKKTGAQEGPPRLRLSASLKFTFVKGGIPNGRVTICPILTETCQ
jgi:hypothetical protein